MQWGHILRIFVNVRFRHETLQSTTRSLHNRFFSRQLHSLRQKKQVTTLKIFLVTPGFREQYKLEVSDLSRIPTLAAPPPPGSMFYNNLLFSRNSRSEDLRYFLHRPQFSSCSLHYRISTSGEAQFSGLYANCLPSRWSVFWTLR